MTGDGAYVPVPGSDDRFMAVAIWDVERWAVSVPKYGGTGRANIFADTLAKVVPNAQLVIRALHAPQRVDLTSCLDVNVGLEPELLERYTNARDPFDAAAVLAEAGLCDDDIDSIVRSRIATVFDRTVPGLADDPWWSGR